MGKWSLKPAKELSEDYLKRISRYLSVEMASSKSADQALSKLTVSDFLIVLDEQGRAFDSIGLAKWIESKKMDATKSLVFLVGPGEGLPQSIKAKANLLLRLSDFTLQHELALVVLMEQIYRACTILKGEPYHK